MRFVFSIFATILLNLSISFAQDGAQPPVPEDIQPRDNLTLAPGTQITIDRETHLPYFTFPNIVNEKWPENTAIGKLKRRALIEELIYRKFSVEFLLKARERMKYMLVALGQDQDPELFSPQELNDALNSAFSVVQFREMHTKYIERAMNPTIEKFDFDPDSLRGFLTHLVEESVTIVRRESEIARVELETKQDLLQAGWNGVNWEKTDEDWRDMCGIARDKLTSPALIERPQINPVLKLRATQNSQIKALLENLQAQSSDRVLFTPFNYEKNFEELDGDITILRDLNRIRPNTSSKQLLDFRHNQGMVSNVIVAYVLQDLKFEWRKADDQFSRSELICTNWNLIASRIPELTDGIWKKIIDAYSKGLVESLKVNEQALLYLLSFSKKGLGEDFSGHRKWPGVESLPDDLDQVLDKFVDLVPTFQNSPEIMSWVREVYPMGDEDPKFVIRALQVAQKEREKRLQNDEYMMKAITIASFVAMGSGIFVEWKISNRFATAFLGLTTAVTLFNNMVPGFVYRQDMRNLVEGLFFHIEPKTNHETIYDIDPVELEKVTILDRQTAIELFTMGATLMASGVWTGRKAIPSIFTMLVRASRRWITNGYVEVDTKTLLQVQEDITKIMSLAKKEFPKEWEILENTGYTKRFSRNVAGYMPEKSWESMFPEIYKKLKALGLRAGMGEGDQFRVIQSINRKFGTQIPGRAQLWEIAEALGYVDEKLISSKSMRAILEIDKPYRARASMDFLKRNVQNKLARLHEDVEQQIRHYHNTGESITSDELRAIQKDKAHMEQMQTLSAELNKALGTVPFDDQESFEVKKTLSKLRDMGDAYNRNKILKFLVQGTKNIVLFPFRIASRVVPVGAMTSDARRILAERLEAVGLGKLWREEYKFPKLDEAFQKFAQRFNLTVDKETVTNYFHQGVVTGIPAQWFGDRLVRQYSNEQGVDFWHGDINKTVVNITTGQLEAFLKTAIFTGAFTMRQRTAMSMGVTFAANALLTFPTNALYTLFENHFNLEDAFKTYTNPNCIMSMSNRIATAGLFHSAYSTLRGRGTYILRNVLKSPQYGGIQLPNGKLGMKNITRGQIVVISFFDKAIFGSAAWAALTNVTQGSGTCKPFKDPYSQDLAISNWTPQEDENFKNEIERRTGFQMHWTAEEVKALEEHYKNEDLENGISPIQTGPNPVRRNETEDQRLERELGVLHKKG